MDRIPLFPLNPDHRDLFVFAQISCYLLAAIQFLSLIGIPTTLAPIFDLQHTTLPDRIVVMLNAAATNAIFAVGYCLLARLLRNCTLLTWRVAVALFSVNALLIGISLLVKPALLGFCTAALTIGAVATLYAGRHNVISIIQNIEI
ncbi:hypothetical protein [Paraburkholderia sp.]|uniref:hypothetical protein n=1 Tax=Paraburkholderia sp. TaxID=1926495 RepID=UPI0039E2B690